MTEKKKCTLRKNALAGKRCEAGVKNQNSEFCQIAQPHLSALDGARALLFPVRRYRSAFFFRQAHGLEGRETGVRNSGAEGLRSEEAAKLGRVSVVVGAGFFSGFGGVCRQA